MSKEILPRTSPDFSIGEMLAVGAVKAVSERAIAKTRVGNGSLKSGLVKLAGAGLVYASSKKMGGNFKKVAGVVSTAWTVDGVEDILTDLVNRWNARNSSGMSRGI